MHFYGEALFNSAGIGALIQPPIRHSGTGLNPMY